jgi:hypothetical protein
MYVCPNAMMHQALAYTAAAVQLPALPSNSDADEGMLA